MRLLLERLGKGIAAAVMVGATLLALSPRFTLWRLIELKMELLIQCVPAFLVGLHWSRLRAWPAFFGLAAGTLFVVVCVVLGRKRTEPFTISCRNDDARRGLAKECGVEPAFDSHASRIET